MPEVPDVLIVGSVALDTVETPRDRRSDLLGGAATYASLAARKVGARPAIVGVVGQDFGQERLQVFCDEGIDISSLEQRPGRTFRWSGKYLANINERETLSTELGVFATFSPRIPPEQRSARFVFLANIDPDIQLGLLDQLDAPQFVAADSMNLWLNRNRDAVMQVFSRSHLVLLNDEEAALLYPGAGVRAVGGRILALGPRYVVVKRGEHGSVVISHEGLFVCPAFPVARVVDPTGAGDTFAGGLLGHLAVTGDLSPNNVRRAVACGTVAASFAVETFGVDGLRSATLEHLHHRYEELRYMMMVPPLAERSLG